ncbi:GNAT family N-acetyltransferase [Propioniciclava coleopterorum]|uniref:GNAT family N-acetyltransferase n=1 Tax=Propioniciclava coleopterorum TaxID=2714937 RepID=A0A6G7Y8T8_9ACTN|nr:GNAT family N-acetyltransferase [Propioniciclava coleopterorum]QIK73096.1 GNAT family N-acetyltransferase [Propioniciclava coleopterorum]
MHARVLDEGDRALVAELLARDPVGNCFVASRVDAGILSLGPGELWGYPAHAPRALLHVGANIVAVNPDDEALDAFTEDLGRWRRFVAIVGPTPVALGLWRRLTRRYGRPYAEPRLVRERQFLMARSAPSPAAPDPRVRRARASDYDSYLAGAVAMYREELDEDPLATNFAGYRRYVRSLIDARRAFAITDDGEVVFKADLGAVSPAVAQVQGVWVAPRLRGQGLSVPAMAAVTNAIVEDGRIASLYVNDFNTPAVSCYRSCGYAIVDELASVLY